LKPQKTVAENSSDPVQKNIACNYSRETGGDSKLKTYLAPCRERTRRKARPVLAYESREEKGDEQRCTSTVTRPKPR
jgi:hypothetical protein